MFTYSYKQWPSGPCGQILSEAKAVWNGQMLFVWTRLPCWDNPAGDQNQGHLLAHDIDAEMLAVAIWTASPQLSSHLEHDR